MKIKIVNEFHGTEVTVIAREHDGKFWLSRSQVKRAKSKLCSRDCTCSGVLGDRGLQEGIEKIIEYRDGSVQILVCEVAE